ncbi:MAG: hypothetical protein PHE09_10750 [Oscillospiraceae bacterium]|nr:hypothetical protein [Oscillospiraceae bacterium]
MIENVTVKLAYLFSLAMGAASVIQTVWSSAATVVFIIAEGMFRGASSRDCGTKSQGSANLSYTD